MAPSMSKIAIIAAAAIVASSSTSTDFRVQQTGAVRLAVRANEPEVAAVKRDEKWMENVRKAADDESMTFESFEAEPKYVEPKSGFLSESPEEENALAKDAKKKFKNFMPHPGFFASREAKEQWEAKKATWDLKMAVALELPSKVAKYQKDKKAAAIKAAQARYENEHKEWSARKSVFDQDAQRLIDEQADRAHAIKIALDEQADRAQAIKIALIALSIIACPVLLVFLVHWCRSADADEDEDDDDYDSEYESELEEDYGLDSETEAGEVETHAKMSQLTVAGASTGSTFARAKSSTRSAKSAASRGSQKKRVMRV